MPMSTGPATVRFRASLSSEASFNAADLEVEARLHPARAGLEPGAQRGDLTISML